MGMNNSTTTTTKRAAKGGEIGANGEFYEGGKFINTIPENSKREGSSPRKARKVQVAPFVWVTDDRTPIFSLVGAAAEYVNRYDRQNVQIKPFAPAFNADGSPRMGVGSRTLEEVRILCDRFNAGEVWI